MSSDYFFYYQLQVLGKEVYTSNNQLGGVQIMYNNGVTHDVVANDFDGVVKILQYLSYMPKVRYIVLLCWLYFNYGVAASCLFFFSVKYTNFHFYLYAYYSFKMKWVYMCHPSLFQWEPQLFFNFQISDLELILLQGGWSLSHSRFFSCLFFCFNFDNNNII